MAVELQLAVADNRNVPGPDDVESWVLRTLSAISVQPAGLTVRVVEEAEITDLNRRYRNKEGPTNVLAFPSDLPKVIEYPYLGDIIICLPVVKTESKQQVKTVRSHFAHMVIHGTLHLCGYDHQDDAEADEMETIEQRILAELKFD